MAICAAAAHLALAAAAQADTAADRFQPHRGLNFDIWVDWLPTEQIVSQKGFLDLYPDWRSHVSPAAITALKSQGYDFARLPMDPAPLLRLGPGAPQDALIDQIGQAAAQVQMTGLKVIIDMHAFPRDDAWGVDSLMDTPALFDAYVTLIGKIAARLNGMDPDRTAFELLNEPTNDCDAIYGDSPAAWPAMQIRLHDAARAAAPDLPLVLSGACWGGADGLAKLSPSPDANTLYSFHSYTPFLFSHQAATWTGGLESVLRHLPYPPTLLTDAEAATLAKAAATFAASHGITTDPPATLDNLTTAIAAYRDSADGHITDDIGVAAHWAASHDIPPNRLLLGEFGANADPTTATAADTASRLRFLTAKRQAAEALGISWAVWSWSGSFGVAADTPDRAPYPAVCNALGLTC